MKKSFFPIYLLLLFFSLVEFNEIKAQSCCPEFEMQFPKFNCESGDCPQNGTGLPGADRPAVMCQYSTNKIQVVPGIPSGFTYVWDVTGGTINGNVLTTLSTPISYIDVTWGNGTLGIIKVTIYNSDSSCFKVLTQQFCLTKSPKALFVKNTGDTVCRNQAITFTNTSLGVYTNWYWNFGDGNSQNGGMSVSHAFNTAGVYIVALTVSNSKDQQSNCGCSNTYYDTITVDNSTGLQILTPDCRKMHCAGDTVTYCASIPGCSSYNWSALGGTVIGSGSCIKVVWNALTSSIINPTVSLTIPAACAGSCGNTTSFIEKVLYNGMPIQGNNIVCENAASTYTLPALPGVFYTWSILPATGYTIINGTDLNTPAFGVIFTAAGNYTITCNYIDSLRNCQGSSSITVSVRPSFSIMGPATSCESCNSTFTTNPPGIFNWYINTVGPISLPGTGSISNTWTSGQVGTFTVTATQVGSAFCNSPQQAIIVVAPKPVLSIFQSMNVACPGTVVKFWVSSTVTDMDVTWTYPPGTQVLNNPGSILDTIYLSFPSAGTNTVTATQFCKYNCTSTSISTSVGNPPAPVLSSPKTTVCIDEVVNYQVASPIPGIVYTWSIANTNLGTIQSGQGTSSVNILWHGNVSNSGVLSVSHCGGTATAIITVILPITVTIGKTGSCISNGVGYTLTAGPNGQTSYVWNPGNISGQTLTNVTVPGIYTVTVNGGVGGSCAVSKSITILPDGYRFAIAPPCIVSNCNLNSFSIPLSQQELTIPCAATLQWYFKPVGNPNFSAIPAATSANYNATQLGCYKCVATCAGGCNVTSNTICIPDDIYFCCSSAACSNITFGIDFTYSGCSPTVFNGFYTGTGSPTGGFPVYYCYGDGTSSLLPPLLQPHQYGAAGQYNVCISQKTLVFNTSSGTNDTCCISNCKTVDVPVVANLSASYNCNTGILSMSDASSYYPTSAGATYTWSITGGTYTGLLGNTISEAVTPTSSGPFTITLSVTKGTCTSTASTIVNVAMPSAAFTVSPNPTCSGNITYFNAASGFASYKWKFGDGAYSLLAPAGNPQHQYFNNTNAPIAFTATLIITTIDGCIDSSMQIVIVHPKPIVTVTPNPATICRGGSVVLTANINPNGNSMCSSYNYQWIKNGTNISGATSSTYTATTFGQYSVFVSGSTPSCNCTMISDTALVKLFPEAIAKIETPSTVCFDPAANPWSFNLNAANYAGYTYNWSCSIAGISFSPNGSTSNFTTATGTLVNNNNFVIYLQVVDANGCVAYDSLCIYTFKIPTVAISASGTLCSNSINTISVTTPNINENYTWNTGATGPVISTTLAGNFYATATNLRTGCSAISNYININDAPSLQLFPIGCDTICNDKYISIPLAQLPNLSNYFVKWFDGIKPAGALIYSGNGAITIPANSLSLGIHHLWTTVSLPNGCEDSSGVYDVFIKKCCTCAGSSWAFREFSIDNGATYQNWVCGNPEIAISCTPLIVNAAYNCSPGGCAGAVTGQVLDNLGNVILNIPSFPYTYTPTPGTSGNFYIKMIGWCDGVKCDSCTRQVFYNCPIPEPPCGCDTAFHFTGQPTIVLPQIDEGFTGGGTPVPMTCGSTYPTNLECQKPYQFFINYQHPWLSGNCQTMVTGEVILAGNTVYTQNNISLASPLNYVFTNEGFYCVKFKLKVNGITCDSCTICFNVVCIPTCTCVGGFHFTGTPVIIASLPNNPNNPNNPNASIAIVFPPPIVCNTSLARPLMCNTIYSFYTNYANPYTLPCIAKDSAVITKSGIAAPLVINPNTTAGNPISYTFSSSGTYCVKQYLVVNGVICDSCIICFNVECPTQCNCNAFDFLSNPTITFSTGGTTGFPVLSSLSSPCETSMATQLICNRQYKFFIEAGQIGAQLPEGCVATVKATLMINNVAVSTLQNNSFANPLIYTFNTAGIYCIKYELFVNGILCKTCTQCFMVKCCTLIDIPPTPIDVIGLTNVCAFVGNGVQLTYSVPEVAGATSYNWTVPPTVTLVSGQGTNSIVVTINAGFIANANKLIRVSASSPCGTSAERLFWLVAQFPTTPSPITASTTDICPSLGTTVSVTFSIPPVSSASSYIWSAQAGTTIISHPNGTGANDTEVSVTFSSGFSSSLITVSSVNDCGVSGTRSLMITRKNPSTPSLISGPINACEFISPGGTPATYSVPQGDNVASYTWLAPAGAIGLSGQGSNSISFIFPVGFTSGMVKVLATNGCGTSSQRSLNISRLSPATPGVIDVINSSFCPNRQTSYTIASVPSNATSLSWTIPAGGTLISGQGTASILVSYPSTAVVGSVTVTALNNCGTSGTRSVDVKLPACPPDPIFTRNNNLPQQENIFKPDSPVNIEVSPNPTHDNFRVRLLTSGREKISARILDLQGREIKKMMITPGIWQTFGNEMRPGVYMIEVIQSKNRIVRKLIKI